MNWILDHFQVVIVIALAFASWLKHRADVKNAEAEERNARDEMAGEEEYTIPDEEWQLPPGNPQPSVPPPLVRPAQPPTRNIPPPIAMARQEAAREAAAMLKHQTDLQERLRQIKETRATTTGGASATRARVAASQSHAKPLMAVKASLRSSLRDPLQTRRAVVLREILGPPPGLS